MTTRWCLVTGGAGFVGSRLIRALNDTGCDRILLVDSFSRRPEKLAGTSALRFADFLHYFSIDSLDLDDLDRWLHAHVDSLKSPVVGFRFFNLFGLGEEHKAHNASIPTRFFQFLRDQGFIELFDAEIRRDYVHADDVARVVLRAWESEQASGV